MKKKQAKIAVCFGCWFFFLYFWGMGKGGGVCRSWPINWIKFRLKCKWKTPTKGDRQACCWIISEMASYAQHQKLNKHLIKNIKGNTFLMRQPKQSEKNKINIEKNSLRKVCSGRWKKVTAVKREKEKKIGKKRHFLAQNAENKIKNFTPYQFC